MPDCLCHGLPKAANRQCIVKRREAQARYGRSKKGRDTYARYQRTAGGWARSHRHSLRKQRANVLERLGELEAEREGLNGGA